MRFWVNAFIPNSVCELCGDSYAVRAPTGALFSADQREFSSDTAAMARAHSEVIIDGISSDNPEYTEFHVCGETHRIDAAGNVLESAIATTDAMRFANLRGSQTVDPEGGVIDGIPGSIQIDFQGLGRNPLMAAPAFDWSGTLTIDREKRRVSVQGAVNDFPAFEMYCILDGGPVLTIVRKNPVTPMDLFGEEDKSIAGSVDF